MKRINHDHHRDSTDELLSRLLRGEAGGGELEHALLNEFHRGCPVSKLRLLLHAEDDKAAAAGMWIASELGISAKPLFRDIVKLMCHRAIKVRFFSLDCVLVCAGSRDASAINLGVDLIDDPEFAVRWKAMVFLTSVNDTLLRAALIARMWHDKSDQRAQRFLQLLASVGTRDSAAILVALTDGDLLVRRFAAAMGARMTARDLDPINQAVQSTEPTIRQFAQDMLARFRIEQRR